MLCKAHNAMVRHRSGVAAHEFNMSEVSITEVITVARKKFCGFRLKV